MNYYLILSTVSNSGKSFFSYMLKEYLKEREKTFLMLLSDKGHILKGDKFIHISSLRYLLKEFEEENIIIDVDANSYNLINTLNLSAFNDRVEKEGGKLRVFWVFNGIISDYATFEEFLKTHENLDVTAVKNVFFKDFPLEYKKVLNISQNPFSVRRNPLEYFFLTNTPYKKIKDLNMNSIVKKSVIESFNKNFSSIKRIFDER